MMSSSFPMVPAPLTSGDANTNLSGIAVQEVNSNGSALVSISVVMPAGGDHGIVLGVLLDEAAFDLFCRLIAPIVSARANGNSVDPRILPRLHALPAVH